MAFDSAEKQRARRARTEARREMERVAMAGTCVTYRRLVNEITAQRFACNGSALTDLLCRGSQATYSEKGVLLSAVVVRKREGTPGRGFFDFASQILKLDVGEDEEAFWRKQVRMVHGVAAQ